MIIKNRLFKIIQQIIVELLAYSLILWGILLLFMPAFSPFNSIILITLGIILLFCIRIVEDIKNIKIPNIPPSPHNTPQDITNSPLKIIINRKIDFESPEEFNKQHPDILNKINEFFKDGLFQSQFTDSNKEDIFQKQNISVLSLDQLNEYLNRVIENNEFEIAAEIRDEINKRKTSSQSE